MLNEKTIPKDIPLEEREGIQICKLQRTDRNWTFCLDNRRDCGYLDITVLSQTPEKIEGRDGRKGFYLCSLNCNSWLYKSEEKYGT